MNKPFFLYTLDNEDLESCLDVMDKNITPETVEKLKNIIMKNDGSRLCELLTETAFNYIYNLIDSHFPIN